jgi:hypothetical protein
MHSHKYTVALVSLVLLCCTVPKKNEAKSAGSDTLAKERIIPYHEDSIVKHSREQLFLANISQLIGLPAITNGNEGLYVRIWIWDGEKKYIVSVSKDQADNNCHIVEWNSKIKDSAEYLIIHRELKNVQPKSGWKNLWTAVEKFRIADLRSGKSYKAQTSRLTEMAYVQFEIAKPHHYRYYEYLQPSYYRYIDEGSADVYAFLKYLSSEINVPIYNPDDNLFIKPE